MPTKGSCCVVLNEKEEVLLVLREDFRIWTLPGGGLEPNETWEQAAARETLEETGYAVEIKQYVGEYWRPQLSHGKGDLMHVFIAQAKSGSPVRHDKESIEVRWFPTASLPKRTFRFAREHIHDALISPSSPIIKEQHLPIWMAMLVRMALMIRDLRNNIFSTAKKDRNNNEPKV
jgi:8-oxo-dGTP diphosphatase